MDPRGEGYPRFSSACKGNPPAPETAQQTLFQQEIHNHSRAEELSSRPIEAGLEIAERQFQAAEVGVVVVADGEGDVDGVSGQKR